VARRAGGAEDVTEDEAREALTQLDPLWDELFEELARRERVGRAYVSRVLRLTLLAPDLVEAILDGRQPIELQLDDLLAGFPLEWEG
jgi:hypothetical protein